MKKLLKYNQIFEELIEKDIEKDIENDDIKKMFIMTNKDKIDTSDTNKDPIRITFSNRLKEILEVIEDEDNFVGLIKYCGWVNQVQYIIMV